MTGPATTGWGELIKTDEEASSGVTSSAFAEAVVLTLLAVFGVDAVDLDAVVLGVVAMSASLFLIGLLIASMTQEFHKNSYF
jgi:hypothetical protein